MKTSYSRILTVSLVACAMVTGSIVLLRQGNAQALTSISGKFYKLDILATSTSVGVSLRPETSINDKGIVGFVGNDRLLAADGIGSVRTLATSGVGINSWTGGIQVNNNDQLLAWVFTGGSGSTRLVRYDVNQVAGPETIASNATAGSSFNNIFKDGFAFNSAGQHAFYGHPVAGPPQRLYAGTTPAFNSIAVGSDTNADNLYRPAMDSSGRIVMRAGSSSSSPIRLYNYALTPISVEEIASVSPTTFSSLGRAAGISDSGGVVVFYGILNVDLGSAPPFPNYNQTYQTVAGPGIFASVAEGAGRRIVRVSGRLIEDMTPSTATPPRPENFDGVCDPGEECTNGELGFTTSGAPIGFSAYDPDARIGVIHQSLGATGPIDDTFIIAFIGTPNSASSGPEYFSSQSGLWTTRVELRADGPIFREKPQRSFPAVQIGDLIGTANQIASIAIYDPIANSATDGAETRIQRRPDHRLVFQASTTSGTTLIVRATHNDSDEDGLPDHWETSGIDFDQNGGVPDLALHQAPYNANPNRKDVFVEIDYMQSATRTHRPGRAPDNSVLPGIDPIARVRNVFGSSPITSQDGPPGVTLHDFVDEEVPEVTLLRFPDRGLNNNDDFDDIKFGSNGPTPGTPCGTAPTDGHFGTVEVV